MSRSSKQKKKKKVAIVVTVLTLAVGAGVGAFVFKDKIFGGKEVVTNNSEMIGVDVSPGDGAETNKSGGDAYKDKNHKVPYYMDHYLGGNPENPILSETEPSTKGK